MFIYSKQIHENIFLEKMKKIYLQMIENEKNIFTNDGNEKKYIYK